MLSKNKLLILTGIFLTVLLCHSVYRDILLIKQYPNDLRNRVVGARLQKDGKLPYFYFWTAEDGGRYWDGDNCHGTRGAGNKITASPFFHELLFPICDFSFLTISRIWFVLQYIMLGCMIIIFCSLTTSLSKKMLVIATGLLFMSTEAWKIQIEQGQLYFFVAFLMSVIIAGLVWNKKSLLVLAGICAGAFVLTRPIALVIFIPFIFQYRKYSLFLGSACAGLVIYALFVLFVPSENALWKEYARALKAHVAFHQDDRARIPLDPCPPINHPKEIMYWENNKISDENLINTYSENGNVFVIYIQIFHKKMPLILLNALSALAILSLTGLYYYRFGKHKPALLQTLILGLSLYMLVEIFSPVRRNQYNAVQWLPIILAGFLFISNWKNIAFLLLAAGLFLNISNAAWIPMRHTLGEFCWLAASLIIVFIPQNKIEWKRKPL